MASSRKFKGPMNSDTERDSISPYREDSRTEYSKEYKERDIDGDLDGRIRFQNESKDDVDYRHTNLSNNQNGEKLDVKVKFLKPETYLYFFISLFNFFLDFSYSLSYFLSPSLSKSLISSFSL